MWSLWSRSISFRRSRSCPKSGHSADGAHTLEYSSSDVAGNAEYPQLCTVRIDTRKPKTITYGKPTVTRKGTAKIAYRVTDASPCAGTAVVTISVRSSAGLVVDSLDAGEQKTGKKLTASYSYTLAAGALCLQSHGN